MSYSVFIGTRPVLTGFSSLDDATEAARTYRQEHPGTLPLAFLAP